MKKIIVLILLLLLIVQANHSQIGFKRFAVDFYFQPSINNKIDAGYFPTYNFDNDFSEFKNSWN